jgi:hypothetical protein
MSFALSPPVTSYSVPVTMLVASEARKTAAGEIVYCAADCRVNSVSQRSSSAVRPEVARPRALQVVSPSLAVMGLAGQRPALFDKLDEISNLRGCFSAENNGTGGWPAIAASWASTRNAP